MARGAMVKNIANVLGHRVVQLGIIRLLKTPHFLRMFFCTHRRKIFFLLPKARDTSATMARGAMVKNMVKVFIPWVDQIGIFCVTITFQIFENAL